MTGAVAGLRGTGDWGPDERPTDFRESILFYNPNGTAPIFALTGKAGKKTVNDPQFQWWAEPNTLWRSTLNLSGGNLQPTDTTFTLTSADPTSTTPGVVWSSALHLKPGDVLLVEPASDAVNLTTQERIQVQNVLSDTQFVAIRGVAGTTPTSPNIPDLTNLTKIGSSFAEGTGAPTAVSRNPIEYRNYTQIFKDTYALTGTTNGTFARTGNAWSNDKKRKMFDHARDIEMAFLFNGAPFQTVGDNGKPLRFMAGLRTFIPATNTTVYTVPTTVSTFLDAVNPMFNFDTEGGDTRICFAGNQAIIELNKIVQASTNLRINFSQEIKIYGLDFKEFILPRGRLLIRSHPLLSLHGLYRKSMFAIDFASLKYVCMKGRDTKVKDDVQLPDEDVRRGFVQTDCSIMVDRGGLTCAYLGNISAT